MAFVKEVKNKSYFRKFQVKLRRRRQGKTDYRARNRLVIQDKNKYDSPRLRFVVRITNSQVICQVVSAKICGDFVIAHASSTELKHYGIPVGHTNYPASYATGLLAAKKLLAKYKRDGQSSVEIADDKIGEEFYIEDALADGASRPFRCVLDVGITSTSKGNRVFGAMKGACDGGLSIPHSTKCFPGFEKGASGSEGKYNAKVHRDRITGVHVANYMKELQSDDSEKYSRQFSAFIKNGIKADDVPSMYLKAFKMIRHNPGNGTTDKSKKERALKKANKLNKVGQPKKTGLVMYKSKKGEYPRYRKLTKVQRRQNVTKKMHAFAAQVAL